LYKNSLIIIIIISEKKKRERENIEATSKGKTPRSQTYANTRQEEKKANKMRSLFLLNNEYLNIHQIKSEKQ